MALWPETVIRLVAELAMAHGRVGRDIERLADGRRKELRSRAEGVFADFEERVLPFDAKAAVLYATIVSDRDPAGLPIDGFDAQIVSICRAHRAALATRNSKEVASGRWCNVQRA